MSVACDYCGAGAELVGGDVVYPHRPDLRSKKFWRCVPCKARVGCHPRTTVPLGRLANAELRAAKMLAHAAFDPLWKGKAPGQRGRTYAELAKRLGILQEDCHIGMFSVEDCERVVKVCREIAVERGIA